MILPFVGQIPRLPLVAQDKFARDDPPSSKKEIPRTYVLRLGEITADLPIFAGATKGRPFFAKGFRRRPDKQHRDYGGQDGRASVLRIKKSTAYLRARLKRSTVDLPIFAGATKGRPFFALLATKGGAAYANSFRRRPDKQHRDYGGQDGRTRLR